MSQVSGELVPFKDTTQLVLPASRMDLVGAETVSSEGIYLATDIVQGKYGAAAFGLVIPRPEVARPFYYNAQEGAAGSYDSRSQEEKSLMNLGDNPLRHAHYFDTMRGFVMLRTVALPHTASEKIKEDQFLAPAVLNKSCLEDTINPEDFDEEYELRQYWSIGPTMSEEHLPLVEDRLMRCLADVHGEPYSIHRQYVSWHSYRAYAQIIEAVTRASQATVANLDRVFAMLTGYSVLPVFEQTRQITSPTPVEITPTRSEP